MQLCKHTGCFLKISPKVINYILFFETITHKKRIKGSLFDIDTKSNVIAKIFTRLQQIKHRFEPTVFFLTQNFDTLIVKMNPKNLFVCKNEFKIH